MSEPNQMNNPDASAIVPLKRKRGRPRKHPRTVLDRMGSVHVPRAQNPNHREISHGAPGFAGINRNNPHQVNPVINASDYMVGQAVHGVIVATFDAGYLLTVRVGNSTTTLRGVVFKPGHFVPVNSNIDVAPGVQMIRRNQVPLRRESYAQGRGRNSRPRERNGTTHAARAANLVPSKGKQVPSVVAQSSAILRGNLVPVVLQPVNLSNGVAGGTSSNTTIPVQAVASKGKQALNATDPSNGPTLSNQTQAVETQFISFQSQYNHQEMPSSVQHKASSVHQNSAQTLQAESKSVPFEKLLTDMIKGVPPQSTDANTSLAAKLSADDSSTASDDYDDDEEEEEEEDDDDEDTDDALSVEPLQAVQPDVRNQPAGGLRKLESYKTGKMTELLQENMTEKPAAQGQNLAADPTQKPNQTI